MALKQHLLYVLEPESLPRYLKECQSLEFFKSKTKNWILENYPCKLCKPWELGTKCLPWFFLMSIRFGGGSSSHVNPGMLVFVTIMMVIDYLHRECHSGCSRDIESATNLIIL